MVEKWWSNHVVINVKPTGNTQWIGKSYDLITCNGFIDNCEDLNNPEELWQLRVQISKLPVRVNVPKFFTVMSLPRYYLIVAELTEVNDELMVSRIVDIVGIRVDLSPTSWSYRAGYWHPQAQYLIIKTIDRYLRKLEDQQVETQQETQQGSASV